MIGSISGFKKAEAVWLNDKSGSMNVQAGFEMEFEKVDQKNYTLHIAGSTMYKISINDSFVHSGPARGPHGYLRIDRIPINNYIIAGENHVFIEVAGYNIGTLSTIEIPSFIQVEITDDDNNVICYSGINADIRGHEISERVRKSVRYSYQRNFSEIYHMENEKNIPLYEKPEVVQHNKKFLEREVPFPKYIVNSPEKIIEEGNVTHTKKNRELLLKMRFIDKISNEIQGYKYEDIKEHPFEIVQECEFSRDNRNALQRNIVNINENRYVLYDMGCNNVGFILASIKAEEDSEIYFSFDEKLVNGKIDSQNWSYVNVIKYSLKASNKLYNIESFESYGFRYIQFFLLKGQISLEFKGIREFSYPNYSNTVFHSKDDAINDIYKAAVETYRQNTLDVFMDCPSRERAGWLCDSYFTAQAEQFFSGEPTVEKIMLENFILAENFPFIPNGMLPMCYPAEQKNGNFIPQWALWYVIELDQYFKRNVHADKEDFRKLCYELLSFFEDYINGDGLLENLPGWNFIEWSDANKYIKDIHYPTNMLYSKVIEIIGELYDDNSLLVQSLRIKNAIIDQSFDGTCFIDNATRKIDGTLESTKNKSEVCQYFAFFFGLANFEDEEFNELKHLILNVFGPNRKKLGIMPEVAYANAFIGNYLRMEILMKNKYYHRVIIDAKEYFHHMAMKTGTLWESDDMLFGSLNHGFASFAGVVFIKCILGIQNIDLKNKTIELDFSYQKIEAAGKVGTIFGDIEVKRKLKNGKLITEYIVPDGILAIIKS